MQTKTRHRLFVFGMYWRIAYGFFRIIFGLALLKVVGSPLIDVLSVLMSHEYIEDPNDILYKTISLILQQHPLSVTYFLPIYFFFWGIVDIVLSYSLLKRQLWAFPASFVVIGGFIAYEIIRFTHTHSLILLSVIIIDSFILWLIWREYKNLTASTDTATRERA